jgi:hypothetical protein
MVGLDVGVVVGFDEMGFDSRDAGGEPVRAIAMERPGLAGVSP